MWTGSAMTQPVNKNYFDWLTRQIRIPPQAPKSYLEMFSVLYGTQFVWTIPGDDNRAHDGTDLRREFHEQSLIDEPIFVGPASVLEVLVALSRKVAFAAGGESEPWAWELLVNLGLEHFSDPMSGQQREELKARLEELLWRQYNPNGYGGFFPLTHPATDQTQLEIWKQMQAYVNEIDIPK